MTITFLIFYLSLTESVLPDKDLSTTMFKTIKNSTGTLKYPFLKPIFNEIIETIGSNKERYEFAKKYMTSFWNWLMDTVSKMQNLESLTQCYCF